MSPSAPGTSTVHGGSAGVTFSPGQHPADDPGQVVGQPIDASSGEVHAVVLEPSIGPGRVVGPIGELEIAVTGCRRLVELTVVFAEGVDAGLLLRVGVLHVGSGAQAEPHHVTDPLVAGFVDDGFDGVVDGVAGVVVAAHDHQDVAQLAVEILHRGNDVGRAVSLATDA